jgi:hypothetical protein
MTRYDSQEVLDTLTERVYDSIAWNLQQISEGETKEIYFHDIVHEELDDVISKLSRTEQMAIIDDFGGEENVDSGCIDTSSLDRMVATTSYLVLEQELFNNDFIASDLQMALNNETIDFKTAKKILRKLQVQIKEIEA